MARGRDRGRARRAEPAARPRARVAGPVPRGSAGAPRHARERGARCRERRRTLQRGRAPRGPGRGAGHRPRAGRARGRRGSLQRAGARPRPDGARPAAEGGARPRPPDRDPLRLLGLGRAAARQPARWCADAPRWRARRRAVGELRERRSARAAAARGRLRGRGRERSLRRHRRLDRHRRRTHRVRGELVPGPRLGPAPAGLPPRGLLAPPAPRVLARRTRRELPSRRARCRLPPVDPAPSQPADREAGDPRAPSHLRTTRPGLGRGRSFREIADVPPCASAGRDRAAAGVRGSRPEASGSPPFPRVQPVPSFSTDHSAPASSSSRSSTVLVPGTMRAFACTILPTPFRKISGAWCQPPPLRKAHWKAPVWAWSRQTAKPRPLVPSQPTSIARESASPKSVISAVSCQFSPPHTETPTSSSEKPSPKMPMMRSDVGSLASARNLPSASVLTNCPVVRRSSASAWRSASPPGTGCSPRDQEVARRALPGGVEALKSRKN